MSECPVCGKVGVKACVDAFGRDLSYDHDGRPPFFDERAAVALDSMGRLAHTIPTPPGEREEGA